ncbi:MAG: TRAP transporter small permease [Rhodospirillales bacterium]|nr:TRAP transporter small permease [Rhodospirillales bacterium]
MKQPSASSGTPPRSLGAALLWVLRNSLEILAGAMLVAICIIVFAGVFFRYFLHIGLGWTEEAARYLQVWMTFIGATVAVKRWSHFQLLLVNDRIPASWQRGTRIFALCVVMALAAVMIVNGAEITEISWAQTSPIMSWNFGYLYLVVPVSGVLIMGFAIRHLIDALRGEIAAAAGIMPHELPSAGAGQARSE